MRDVAPVDVAGTGKAVNSDACSGVLVQTPAEPDSRGKRRTSRQAHEAQSTPAAGARAAAGSRTAGGWRDLLLDPWQADRLSRAVRVAINNMAGGYPSLLHVDLRVELIGPAETYLAEHWRTEADNSRSDVRACLALVEMAADVADKIEDGASFCEVAGDSYAQRLRAAWSTFIEHAAGPELIHQSAEASARQQKRARGPRFKWSSSDTGETLTPDLIRARIAGGRVAGKLQKQILGDLSIEFRAPGPKPGTERHPSLRQLERLLSAPAPAI